MERARVELLATLRALLKNDQATWSSQGQQRLCEAVEARQGDVIGILATGAGKTMAALLPAVMHKEETVILVVSLLSLLYEHERRLDRFHIPFQVFRSGVRISAQTNLILVNIDVATMRSFREAIQKHHHVRPVTRLIFDKVHYALTATNYRTVLKFVYDLRFLPMQFVLLSGTLPPFATRALSQICRLVQGTYISYE